MFLSAMHLNMAYIDKQHYSFTESNQDKYMQRRIMAGWAAYAKTRIRCIFKSNIAICLKTHVYDSFVLPALT